MDLSIGTCKNFITMSWLLCVLKLTSLMLVSAKRSHTKEPVCQPVALHELDLPPKIFHQYLNSSFLEDFDEIIFIGDLHGCHDELQLLLKSANATSDRVLKIFSGDLTRKGIKNLEVVRFTKNCASCLSVRGNNDEITIFKVYWYKNGNNTLETLDRWMSQLTDDEFDWMRELPYTISILPLNAIAVHGGFIPGIPLEENNPFTMMNIRDLIPQADCPGGWQATRAQLIPYPWASKWKGPTHVYFGHDHARQLQLYPYATGVDTDCVQGYFMTGVFIMGPRKGTFVTQPALHTYYIGQVNP